MKRNSIFIFSLVLTIISCTPHDITSSYVPVTNRTAEVHAYECEDALGPLPDLVVLMQLKCQLLKMVFL